MRSPRLGEANALEHLLCRGAPLARGHALHAQAVLDVLLHRHVREERVVLEHGVDVALGGRDAGYVDAGQLDAPLVGPLEAGDQRSVVVLPEPDGPSSVKNSPTAMSRSTPATARTSPKVRRMPVSRTAGGPRVQLAQTQPEPASPRASSRIASPRSSSSSVADSGGSSRITFP